MKCKHDDCFTCPYPDCINDYTPPLQVLTAEQKSRINKRHRDVYLQRKEQGLCAYCGKRPALPNRVRCNDCLQKNRDGARKSWQSRYDTMSRDMMGYLGICMTCGKRPQKAGYKLCAECHAKSVESLKIARAARDPDRVSAWWKGNVEL